MKISEQWLREWVNPSVSTEELAEQLTMAGLEVDSVTDAAAEFKGVVVGRVDSVEPHPDADKLRICQVDAGTGELINIVCGAANVRADLRIPVAMIGAVLPGNFKIKKSKLRGEQSFGMLCSEKELGIAETSEGLMELSDDAPVGTDIREYLDLDDRIIEVDLTPNRGDCASMAGIAREVGVLNRCDVTVPDIQNVDASLTDTFAVQVESKEECPRYLGRLIRGVNPAAETPVWMQERFWRGGIRSLGPMVDVTNYVLLELGHPMHAFDQDLLKGSIHVRKANAGEKLDLLDGNTAELQEDILVIADDEKAVAIAGIMGGQDTAVSDNTTNLFLECAFFSPLSIAGKARQYGLQTDSSYRFERGVNPASLPVAMERATQLLLEIVGGEAGPVVDTCSQEHLPQAKPISLRRQRVERLLGVTIPDDAIKEMLERLEMSVEVNEEGWQVTAPSFRFDIAIEADLIEEIGRIHGYDQLPSRHSSGNMVMNAVSEGQNKLSRIHNILIDRDYQEVVTYSFVDPDLQKILDPDHDAIALANPISSEMGVMRTSLWPGLVQTAAYNLNRQQSRIRIFESGLKFISQDNEIKQKLVISGAISGTLNPEQWAASSQKSDFYDIKSDVETLLQLTGNEEGFIFEASEHPALHPGQSARILHDNNKIGWIGALHPNVLKKQGISDNVYLFELDLEAIFRAEIPKFKALSKYPSTRRDIAIVVDEHITSREIFDAIKGILSSQLQEIRLFDVYRGKGVDSGRKSLALALIFQESSRTLIDEDMDTAIEQVMEKLKKQFDATLRE